MMQEAELELADKLTQLTFETKLEHMVMLKLDQLQNNLHLIRQNKWDVSILKYVRDFDILLYDTALNYDPSMNNIELLEIQHDIYGEEYDNTTNYDNKALLESQMAKLLINLSLHKPKICKVYNKAYMQSLAKSLRFYAIGYKCGFDYEACNIVGLVLLMIIFFGTIVLIGVNSSGN